MQISEELNVDITNAEDTRKVAYVDEKGNYIGEEEFKAIY